MSGKIGGMILALVLCLGLAIVAGSPAVAQTITLRGASQFDDNHSYNQTMLKFAEQVQKYYGKPVNFVLHRNRELGLEKDYFSYMSQGISVDYAVFAPSHAATFSKVATLMDMPFLFRDVDHWSKVLSTGEAFAPTAEDVLKKADVILIGYARRRRAQHRLEQAGPEHGGAQGAEHPGHGCAHPDQHVPGHHSGPDRHCL